MSDRVTRTPGVCGGAACIAGTRVPVWILAAQRVAGLTDAQILDNYPTLKVEDLAAAWAYCRTHSDVVNCDRIANLGPEDM